MVHLPCVNTTLLRLRNPHAVIEYGEPGMGCWQVGDVVAGVSVAPYAICIFPTTWYEFFWETRRVLTKEV
jgi:hypothetical protein